MMFSLNITTVAIIWHGGMRIDSGQMMVGDLRPSAVYHADLVFRHGIRLVRHDHASASVMDQPGGYCPEIKDPSPGRRGPGAWNLKMTFSYPGAEKPP